LIYQPLAEFLSSAPRRAQGITNEQKASAVIPANVPKYRYTKGVGTPTPFIFLAIFLATFSDFKGKP
jgi:hypothetical protein